MASEKGLGILPTVTFIKEADLRRDFVNFARKMWCKWVFCNKPMEDFSEIPAFRINSNLSLPKGHPALEIFQNQMEKDIFTSAW